MSAKITAHIRLELPAIRVPIQHSLPTGLNGVNSTRNAYIFMGILDTEGTNNYYIDAGICWRDNGGWVPYYYEHGSTFQKGDPTYIAPSTAKSAVMTLKPVNANTITLYVQWQDASGNDVGVEYKQNIPFF